MHPQLALRISDVTEKAVRSDRVPADPPRMPVPLPLAMPIQQLQPRRLVWRLRSPVTSPLRVAGR